MPELLTLELPEDVATRARAFAAATNRRIEDAVVDWIRDRVTRAGASELSDAELLERCDSELTPEIQAELSDLLALNREDALTVSQRSRLDELMADYRRRLVDKAAAIREAVSRGLRPAINEHGA